MVHRPTESAVLHLPTAGRYILSLCMSFRKQQLHPTDLLAGTGLSPESLENPKTFVSKWQLERVLSNIAEKTDESFPGLRLGYGLDFSGHGYIGFAGLTAPTVMASLEVACRYSPLITELVSLDLDSCDRYVRVTITPRTELSLQVEHFLVETFLASFDVMCHAAGRNVSLRAEMALSSKQGFRDRLNNTIESLTFDAKGHAILLRHQDVCLSQLMADAIAHKQFIQKCEKALRRLHDQRGMAGQVLEVLRRHELPNAASQQEVAECLAVTARTLQRRLQKENTCFRDLMSEEVIRRSKKYLIEEQRSVTETAYSLGFSDSANFTRFFRQITGSSPSDYIKSAQSKKL